MSINNFEKVYGTLEVGGSEFLDNHELGKVPVFLRKVDAIAGHKNVFDIEAVVIHGYGSLATAWLVEQCAHLEAARVAAPQELRILLNVSPVSMMSSTMSTWRP